MLKEGKPSYTPMREKCDAKIKVKLTNSVKECRLLCRMVNFLSFVKDLRKHGILPYEI